MILEEITGAVTVTVIRETGGQVQLAVGDYFSDHESSTLTAIGSGKAIIRVDPNCTFEVSGVKLIVKEDEVPAVQEMSVTDKVGTTEAPVIIFPEKTAE